MSNSIFRKDGTAQGVAKQRLIETLAKPDKLIINDPYAERFVKEMEGLFAQHGFLLKENKTLADLNAAYFTPVGRALPDNHIIKLEHFVIATS